MQINQFIRVSRIRHLWRDGNRRPRGKYFGCRLNICVSDLRQMGRYLQERHRIRLNYQSIGSGGGIKQIKNKTVTFGASDMPLEAQGTAGFRLGSIPNGGRR